MRYDTLYMHIYVGWDTEREHVLQRESMLYVGWDTERECVLQRECTLQREKECVIESNGLHTPATPRRGMQYDTLYMHIYVGWDAERERVLQREGMLQRERVCCRE